jgi:septum formation topological specificity factor MinE
MPQQEMLFEQQVGDKRIVVLKSYDRAFAHEAFDQMRTEALHFLGRFLEVDDDESVSGTSSDDDHSEVLWQEIQDGAREEWNTFSYFIVSEEAAGRSLPLFVSADWPSAEAFAKQQITR